MFNHPLMNFFASLKKISFSLQCWYILKFSSLKCWYIIEFSSVLVNYLSLLELIYIELLSDEVIWCLSWVCFNYFRCYYMNFRISLLIYTKSDLGFSLFVLNLRPIWMKLTSKNCQLFYIMLFYFCSLSDSSKQWFWNFAACVLRGVCQGSPLTFNIYFIFFFFLKIEF